MNHRLRWPTAGAISDKLRKWAPFGSQCCERKGCLQNSSLRSWLTCVPTFSRSWRSWRPLASLEQRFCSGATTVQMQRPSASWAELYTCHPSFGRMVCTQPQSMMKSQTLNADSSLLVMSQRWYCTAVVRSWLWHHSVSVLRTHLTINSVYFPGWNNFLNFSALEDRFHYWKPHWRMQINLICRRAFPSLLHRICFTVRIWCLKTSEYASGAPAVYLNAASATIVPVKMGFASDIDKNVLNCWKSR